MWGPLARWFLMPMLITALGAELICLVSGLILGWVTKWGLLRYWRVAAKLALNVVMSTLLAVLLLSPFQDIATGRAPLNELSIVFVLSAVATALVTLASLLSVSKSWGRPPLPPSRQPPTTSHSNNAAHLLPNEAARAGRRRRRFMATPIKASL